MLRDAFSQLQRGLLSRREFLTTLTTLGVGALAAGQLADAVAAAGDAEHERIFKNISGGQVTCETLSLWGVQYVFGNTGAYEAGFVDALVEGGWLIVSGIVEQEWPTVEHTVTASRCELVTVDADGPWRSGLFRLRA